MIVFDVGDDQGLRAIVEELRTLVEKRRIVLVRLDDEERCASQPRGHGEVQRHSADQEPRLQAGAFQHPGDQRGHRGLPVRARDCDDPAPVQHRLAQPLRSRQIAEAAVQQRFHGRIAARQRIAHQHEIRSGFQVIRRVAFRQRDPGFAQLGAHGRVGIGVRAADLVTELARQTGKPAHEGTADAENVDLHRCATRSCSSGSLIAGAPRALKPARACSRTAAPRRCGHRTRKPAK